MPNMMQGRGMMNVRGGQAEKVALGPALKKLIHYCRSYLPLVVVATVLAITGAVLSLVGPNKISDITNAIVKGSGDKTASAVAICVAAAVMAAGALPLVAQPARASCKTAARASFPASASSRPAHPSSLRA